jgi:hypothetical protein
LLRRDECTHVSITLDGLTPKEAVKAIVEATGVERLED